jgi:hypothetical protein
LLAQVLIAHELAAPVPGGVAAPQRFVENVHPNGPNVFAHEQYVLNGAVPNTTYTVTIHITTLADTTCAAPFLNLDTATVNDECRRQRLGDESLHARGRRRPRQLDRPRLLDGQQRWHRRLRDLLPDDNARLVANPTRGYFFGALQINSVAC